MTAPHVPTPRPQPDADGTQPLSVEPPFVDPFFIDADALIAGVASLTNWQPLPEWMTRPSLSETIEEIEMTAPHDTPADGPPDARPLADMMRELAAIANDGRVTVDAETVMLWANEIERLRNTLLSIPSILNGCAQVTDEAGMTEFTAAIRWKSNQVKDALTPPAD